MLYKLGQQIRWKYFIGKVIAIYIAPVDYKQNLYLVGFKSPPKDNVNTRSRKPSIWKYINDDLNFPFAITLYETEIRNI